MIKRTEEELQKQLQIVATGGLSTVMAPLVPAIRHIEPLLTLEGLKLVFDYLSK
jgi:type III pantothenate kinase